MRGQIDRLVSGTDTPRGRRYEALSQAIVVLSAAVLALETLPDLTPFWRNALLGLEIFCLTAFAVDFWLRLYSAPDRRAYLTSFWGIIDLLSWLPALFFLAPDWQVVRILKLFRLVRLLKLVRGIAAVERLRYAFRETWDELLVVISAAALVVFLSSVGIYHFEKEAQPDLFKSIPHSMWWAIATLSTVGYGDIYPVTVGGRIFTALVMLVGLGVIAVPAGLITAALLDQSRNPTHRDSNPTREGKEDP